MKRSGVTVWELLAVIIIVLVMIAIMYPVFAPNPEPLRRISCASDLKQLGLAIIQYAQDNDNCQPNIAQIPGSNNTWRIAIFPYGKSKQRLM
jgi:competence protein ComGC